MKRLRLICLTVWQGRLLALLPPLVALLLLPLLLYTSLQLELVESRILSMLSFLMMLGPVGGALWSFAYLQTWVDSDGEESMRATGRGKHIALWDLLILNLIYDVLLIPVFLLTERFLIGMWSELPRIALVGLLYSGAFYLITTLLNSAAMGSLPVIGYHFFCLLFSSNPDMTALCLVKINLAAVEVTFPWAGVAIAGVVLLLAGAVSERFIPRRL